MPSFRLEAEFSLIPALRRLGVNEAFGITADFSGITESEPLQIGAVAHKVSLVAAFAILACVYGLAFVAASWPVGTVAAAVEIKAME